MPLDNKSATYRNSSVKPTLTGWLWAILFLCSGITNTYAQSSRDLQLPSLGDSTSSIISLEQERQLGQEWLREFYRKVPFNEDYLLQDYIEGLIQKLTPYSGLQNTSIHVLVIDNPSLNAFAVPGGIIGVHTGLLEHAQSEGELVSVLGHELAHLSRRHFARSVSTQQNNSMVALAGILAGIVLASTVGGDAGLAAISASQAAALQAQLSYSRQNEQEADRLGMEIMAAAGYNPQDVAKMFERMLAATRYVGFAVPEYLRTHPLADSRITDSQLRADQYSSGLFNANSYYDLMRVRAIANQSDNPGLVIRRFKSELEGGFLAETVANYGLALAYLRNRDFNEGLSIADQLLEDDFDNDAYLLLKVELLTQARRIEEAMQLLEDSRLYISSPHAFVMQMAATLKSANQFKEASMLLEEHSRVRVNDPAVWYELAEMRGLEGDILGVHLARSEYFNLTGAYTQAIEQLRYAKNLAVNDKIQTAIIETKIGEMAIARERRLY